jgi:hypothetical protein
MAKYLSANQVMVRHQFLPARSTASKKLPILTKSNRPLMHVFIDRLGNYFLWQGIEVYQTLKVIYPSLKVPCQIHQGPSNEYQWSIKLLQSCYQENSHWKVKLELIDLLINADGKTVEDVSCDSGIDLGEIKRYVVENEVPDDYKELAINNDKQMLVNEICRNKRLTKDAKNMLYEAVFHYTSPLTIEQYHLFRKYIRDGYTFDPNEADAMMKLKEIVNKNAALVYYWSSLHANRRIVYPKIYFEKKASL